MTITTKEGIELFNWYQAVKAMVPVGISWKMQKDLSKILPVLNSASNSLQEFAAKIEELKNAEEKDAQAIKDVEKARDELLEDPVEFVPTEIDVDGVADILPKDTKLMIGDLELLNHYWGKKEK